METILSARAWQIIWQYRTAFASGLLNTLESAFTGLLLSLFLGCILGLMATSTRRFPRIIARIYVEFFQNTPLILQVCFLYYALAYTGNMLPVTVIGFVSLGIYHAAYVSEVVRAGIEALPKGQFEAAHAQGFGYMDTMLCIILPQTVKIILPPMVNQMVALIKNTSCLYIIGGADLIASTYNFVTGEVTGGAYGPAYIVSGLLFFIICYPLSRAASRWEETLKKRDFNIPVKPRKALVLSDEDINRALSKEAGV